MSRPPMDLVRPPARNSAPLKARLGALLPALALGIAALVTAHFQIDRGAAATTAFFGWLAFGILAPLALLPRTPRALPAATALAVGLALLALPNLGVLRPALTLALLGGAIVAHAAAAGRRGAPLGLAGWIPLALAAQLLAAADRLFLAPTAPTTAGARLALPLGAALALAALERAAGDAPPVAAAALAAFLAGPGWTLAALLALVGAALAARALALRPAARAVAVALAAAAPLAFSAEAPWLALAVLGTAVLALAGPPVSPAVARAATGALLALTLGATLAASLPWRRPAPATALLAASVAPAGRAVERVIETQPVVLSAAAPRFEAALDGAAIGALVLDSYLTRSVDLPCGTPLARVRVELDGGTFEAPLEVGRDSAEWAAERPDVAAALACPAPAPWTSWLPGDGRFLGHHYRARLRLDRPLAARRLVIERAATLPAATQVVLFHLAAER